MHINNFDTSSSGINLDLTVFYDTGRSQWDFDDFFEVIRYSSYSENSVLFYHGGDGELFTGDLSDYYRVVDGVTARELLKEFLNYLDIPPTYTDLRLAVVYAKEHHGYHVPLRQWTVEDVLDYIHQGGLLNDDDITQFMKASHCFSSTLVKYTIRGYCQGDLATVYVPLELDHPELNMREFFERRIYGAPVTCHLTIDDKEYHLNEYVPDDYNSYDKDEYLTIAKTILSREYAQEKLAYILEWLDENLPDEL